MRLSTLVLILLIAVTFSVSVSAPGVRSAQGQPGDAQTGPAASDPGATLSTQAVPAWEQVNSNGFGDSLNIEVSALEAFSGYLYAGTYNVVDPAPLFDGARIFRSANGVAWSPVTLPGFGNPHDTAAPAILDLVVFNEYLYASTGRGNAAQIWRTQNGSAWSPMVSAGFADPDNIEISALAVYNGVLYAGVTNDVTGAQIWRSYSGNSSTWEKVAPTTPGTAAGGVTALVEYNGALYAAVESEAPVQIWRSYGGDWGTIVSNGFGNANTTLTGGMTVFGGYLYVGAGNTINGAQLWRTSNGTNWSPAITPGFGDANNQKIEMVFVFQNYLYTSAKNTLTGIELWRSTDGLAWEQANTDGFGDSNNAGTNRSNATANFLGRLYVGTSNSIDGGELWRIQQLSTYLPVILRSP